MLPCNLLQVVIAAGMMGPRAPRGPACVNPAREPPYISLVILIGSPMPAAPSRRPATRPLAPIKVATPSSAKAKARSGEAPLSS